MKKITLNVEALQVESFEPEAEVKGQRGTVHGHLTALRCSAYYCSNANTCQRCDTYYCSNGDTCYCSNGPTCQEDSCIDTCGYPYAPQC